MDDPVEELRHQRDLVLAHLRWIDEQIARASSAGSPSPPPPASPPPVEAAPPPLASAQRTTAPAAIPPDAEISLPEIDAGMIRSEVRKGCLIYVIGVTALLAASLALAVWIARN